MVNHDELAHSRERAKKVGKDRSVILTSRQNLTANSEKLGGGQSMNLGGGSSLKAAAAQGLVASRVLDGENKGLEAALYIGRGRGLGVRAKREKATRRRAQHGLELESGARKVKVPMGGAHTTERVFF